MICKKWCNIIFIIMLVMLCGVEALQAATCNPLVPKTATPGETVWNILDRIQTTLCADQVIYQEDIPYTISAPGAYCLGEFITNNSDTPAITIASDNVVLNLACHGINQVKSVGAVTRSAIFSNGFMNIVIKNGGILLSGPLTSATTNGVFIQNGFAIVLQDLFINGQSLDGQAVNMLGTNRVEINNIFMQNLNTGIWLNTSEGFRFYGCYVSHVGTGYLFTNTQDGVVDFCIVTDALPTTQGNPGGPGFSIGNNTDVESILFEDCTASTINTTGFLILSSAAIPALDIICKNCVATSCGADGFSTTNSRRTTFSSCISQQNGSISMNGNGFLVVNDLVPTNIINCASINNTNFGYNVTANTNLFNSLAANNGTNFSPGANPTLIATGPTNIANANYWMNVGV